MEHTKGEWKIRKGCTVTYFIELGNEEGIITVFTGSPKRTEEAAHLIVAAPKLLEVCEAMVEDKELIEQDEGIFACQCLARAPDDITEPPKCSYCQAKAAIAATDQEQSKEKKPK